MDRLNVTWTSEGYNSETRVGFVQETNHNNGSVVFVHLGWLWPWLCPVSRNWAS